MTLSHTNPDQLLPSCPQDLGPIVLIGPDRLEEAVGALTAQGSETDTAHARRFIRFSQENKIGLEAFWSRLDHQDNILHSVLCVPNPGHTCMVFASNPSSKRDVLSIGGLIDHASIELFPENLDLAQALLEPSETLLRDAFLLASFSELAMLSYLERPMPTKRQIQALSWPDGFEIHSFKDSMRDELIILLDETYDQTLDCPGLCGLRSTEDILAGHLASGEFDPALWSLLRKQGRPCGALLLNPSPASHAVELVYMGLSPSARGCGLGSKLLQYGMNLLAGRVEHNITLAVDEQNKPAMGLYHKMGFRRVLRRRAMIRSLCKSKSKS